MTTEAVCGRLPSIWTSGAANKAPPANTNDTGMIAKARVWTPGSQTTKIERSGSLFELEQTKP